MATLGELGIKTASSNSKQTDDIGWAKSMAAGVGSGIFKIFEGAATLGATLMDLGVDKDRAEAVEQYFADINPFDEAAAATGIGKITELIVNIGIPGGVAFKMGSGLTKATLAARKKGLKGLSTAEKTRRFGQGALAGGAAEAAFVGDVEDAGTFGDWLGGPTELERDTGEPLDEILNRLKFGAEGALFTGAIGAAGKTVSKLRNQTGTGKAIEGKVNKFIDKWFSKPFRTRGGEDQVGYELRTDMEKAVEADRSRAETAMLKAEYLRNKLAKLTTQKFGKKIGEEKLNALTKQMNDVLMSGGSADGTLQPVFNLVDEFRLDKKTGVPGTTDEFKIIDEVTGKPKQKMNIGIDEMDAGKKEALRKTLQGDPYNIPSKDVTELLNLFTGMRTLWGDLFNTMGSRFDDKAFKEFTDILPDILKDSLDRGYAVFQKNAGLNVATNYPPVKAAIQTAKREFEEVAKSKGLKLSDEALDTMVEKVWKGASLPKGVLLSTKPGTVRFQDMPDFFLKSIADDITKTPKGKVLGGTWSKDDRWIHANMMTVTDVAKPILRKLLGKMENPMSTLVEGTNGLSAQVRFDQYLDNLAKESNKLKVKWDAWDQVVKTSGRKVAGPEPKRPFLVDNKGQANKYFGGRENEDWKKIKGEREKGVGGIGKWEDPMATLKPVDDVAKLALAEKRIVNDILNPVAGKYALKDYAEALKGVKDFQPGLTAQLYQNLVLYPKATSQMAKTILAPFTHARNFISAAAFAGANGLIPFGNTADVKAAWNALQVGSGRFGTRQANEFYEELLRLGVVNSQVQIGDLRRLLEDVDFGGVLNKIGPNYNGLNTFLKKMSKLKKFAQDAYTAEDDFWKIFTFLGEKSRMTNAFKNAGLNLGDDIIEVVTDAEGRQFRRKIGTFNDEYIKKASADLVKNNVPNYARVSEFIKGIRKWPVGNFVAFPAEILRTSTNIVDTALKEINFTVIGKQGKEVKPLAGRGLQRLTGMAITTAAVPLGTVAAMQTIYDIADDEIEAMRRYVPEWSKNSVLIPFKDKDGNLEYVDFSHLNAYDTITRPIQTVINAVNQGRGDEDGLIDDFVLGLIESARELGEPFISESIWTEALQDVAPVLGRRGRDATGRQIWNPEDSLGDKLYKAVSHLAESQAPLNWKQLKRLGLSAMPVDWEGRFDERGNEYELGNELLGIAGMRRVKVQPEKSFNYKITEYKKGIRNSRNLFTSATLKGGVVRPEDVVEAYINANRALYGVNREMYQDVDAAKTLGMSVDKMDINMEKRGERKAFEALNEGRFRPLKISEDVQELFQIRADELGVLNPFDAAQGVLERISEILELTPLSGDFFPEIDNPFKELPLVQPILDAINTAPVTPNNLAAQNVGAAYTQQANSTLGNLNAIQNNNLTTVQDQLLENPLDRLITKKQNINKMQLQRPKNNIMSS